MTSGEIDGIIRLYTTSEDVARPGLGRPWRTITGEVVATDGRVAIVCRNAPKDLYRYDTDYADDSRARRILQWITKDKEDANLGFRVPIPLDFATLARAAAVAIADARRFFTPVPADEFDDDFDDGEPDTPDDFARRYSSVMLPDAHRTEIAARYAEIVAKTVAAFGGTGTLYGWPSGKRPLGRRKEEYKRLLFVGDDYHILLMPLRTRSRIGYWISFARSIADASTGRLVLSYGEGAK